MLLFSQLLYWCYTWNSSLAWLLFGQNGLLGLWTSRHQSSSPPCDVRLLYNKLISPWWISWRPPCSHFLLERDVGREKAKDRVERMWYILKIALFVLLLEWFPWSRFSPFCLVLSLTSYFSLFCRSLSLLSPPVLARISMEKNARSTEMSHPG